MVYTIRINDKSQKAKSIINMLKTLQEDYDFIQLVEANDEHEKWVVKELESRIKLLKKSKSGKSWDKLLKELQ